MSTLWYLHCHTHGATCTDGVNHGQDTLSRLVALVRLPEIQEFISLGEPAYSYPMGDQISFAQTHAGCYRLRLLCEDKEETPIELPPPDDRTITEAMVMYRKVVTRGSRVKHFGEGFTGEATATVVGFYNEGTPQWPAIKVIIKPDRPDNLYAGFPAWDQDRVVLPDAL
jgi:hypothetical protein